MALVIIKTFSSYIDANIARGVLEAIDIPSFLKDEASATIFPVTLIKLLVSEEFVDSAIAALNQTDS
ncbi:MAG: hypothetical protein EPO57_00695 [Chitinophagaceae bacterium]|nr:MAG: hypothetical protein EPO57_00695 [Chitinophagaceae bacterium]